MFVLENRINKQHVYCQREKSGPVECLLHGLENFVFSKCLILCFNNIINCRKRFRAPAGGIFTFHDKFSLLRRGQVSEKFNFPDEAPCKEDFDGCKFSTFETWTFEREPLTNLLCMNFLICLENCNLAVNASHADWSKLRKFLSWEFYNSIRNVKVD